MKTERGVRGDEPEVSYAKKLHGRSGPRKRLALESEEDTSGPDGLTLVARGEDCPEVKHCFLIPISFNFIILIFNLYGWFFFLKVF